MLKFIQTMLSHTNVILNEGQGHSNRYPNVKFSGVYHLAKHERKQSVNVQAQAYMKASL